MRRLVSLVILALALIAAGCDDDSPSNGGDGGGPECGNGVLEEGEECDGTDLGGASCQSEGYTDGTLTCTSDCRLDFSGCTTCGNGIREGDEECDGMDLAGSTCLDFTDGQGRTFTSGTLACSGDCRFDTSGCGVYGNGIKDGTEECDGTDFGGKTCQDFTDGSGEHFTAGKLSCQDGKIDTSACTRCGNGIIEEGEECDSTNLGGHTCADFGFWDPHGDANLRCTESCTLDDSGCDRPVDVCTGDRFACILLASGEVWCWGHIADQDYTRPERVSLGTDHEAVQLACGAAHACALTLSGTPGSYALACWGDNSHHQILSLSGGQTGPDAPVEASMPSGYRNWLQVAAGGNTTCAIAEKDDGSTHLLCWGQNDSCQAGPQGFSANITCPGSDVDQQDPNEVIYSNLLQTPQPVRIAMSRKGGCLIDTTGRVWCWGRQPGRDMDDTNYLIPLDALSDASDLYYSAKMLCVDDGITLRCTGDNTFDLLGFGTAEATPSEEPPPVTFLAGYSMEPVDFAWTDAYDVACLASQDTTWCWGRRTSKIPADDPSDTIHATWGWEDVMTDGAGNLATDRSFMGFRSISLSGGEYTSPHFVCGITERSVYCWGIDSPVGESSTPVEVLLP